MFDWVLNKPLHRFNFDFWAYYCQKYNEKW